MFEDIVKLHHVVNVEVNHAFKIALHTIWKLFVDQLNNLVIAELLYCSAMWGE